MSHYHKVLKYLRTLVPVRQYWIEDGRFVVYDTKDVPNDTYVRSSDYQRICESYQDLKKRGASNVVALELSNKISDLEHKITLHDFTALWNKRAIRLGFFSELSAEYNSTSLERVYDLMCYHTSGKMFRITISGNHLTDISANRYREELISFYLDKAQSFLGGSDDCYNG